MRCLGEIHNVIIVRADFAPRAHRPSHSVQVQVASPHALGIAAPLA